MIELDQEEEAKAEAAPVDLRKNVKKKKAVKIAKDGIAGDIAHYHKKENEYEEWEEPCMFVEFNVQVRDGISLNQHIYNGKVVVPQCTADYLAWQQSAKLQYEANIHRNNGRSRVVGRY